VFQCRSCKKNREEKKTFVGLDVGFSEDLCTVSNTDLTAQDGTGYKNFLRTDRATFQEIIVRVGPRIEKQDSSGSSRSLHPQPDNFGGFVEAGRQLSATPAVNVNRFHPGEPDGNGRRRNGKSTSRRAHGIIPNCAEPAIRDRGF